MTKLKKFMKNNSNKSTSMGELTDVRNELFTLRMLTGYGERNIHKWLVKFQTDYTSKLSK